MKIKSFYKICLLLSVLTLVMTSVNFAQAQQASQPAAAKAVKEEPKKNETKREHPREAYPPDQRPEENYLARFKAIEISEYLIKENVENIYMLKVIVTNFKEQGWESEYNGIYEEYKKAVGKYYRRQVIYSRLELEKNKMNISNLFNKIVSVYEDQTQTMLEECADKILDFSLDEKNKFDPNRTKILFQNMMRLWIAYGQVDDADRSTIDGLNKNAVYHLRIAKAYAIQILEQLDPDSSKGQFKVHKADNLNRVLNPETAKSTEAKPSAVK